MTARKSILTRLYVVLVLVLVLPVGVVVQMARIHLGEGRALRAEGLEQSNSLVDIPAARGAIYDRNGRALVVNTARYDVALDPTVPGFAARADELAALLGQLTDRSAAHYRGRIANPSSPKYVMLVRDLDEASKEQLDEADIPGLLVEPKFARRYNYGRLASHALGHVNADLAGIAGLEQRYDDVLSGTPGRRAVQRDRLGRINAFAGAAVTPPQHGEELVLTLDLVRQTILEEELARGVAEADAAWGTAIAMDPHTGEILAIANVPDYNPNRPGAFRTAARRNHAIVDQIEPGSTFKLVTAITALEHGGMSPQDSVETGQGYAVFGGRSMRDTHANGTLTFGDAIRVSSNIGMARVAETFDPGAFYQQARALGFGQPTWIDLPGEISGRLRRPDSWSRSTQTSISIGYSVTATPLQILQAYAALANGGLVVRPYLVQERRALDGTVTWRASQDSVRRAFDAETARRLMPFFEGVVSDSGTARLANVDGLRIAGKTGTARVVVDGRYAGIYRATFAGLFPADDPQVAMVVVLHAPQNGSYGGAVSAPIFANVARRWAGSFPQIAARLHPAEPLPVRENAPVPSLEGLPVTLAAARVRADGFPVSDRGRPWQPVGQQRPQAGDTARTRRAVRLRGTAPGDEAPVMPDLRGLSTRHAVAWLSQLGVRPRLQGGGVVREQRPAPGAALPVQAVLTAR